MGSCSYICGEYGSLFSELQLMICLKMLYLKILSQNKECLTSAVNPDLVLDNS